MKQTNELMLRKCSGGPSRSRLFSAHADYAEMIDWLRASKLAPRRVFVTHGEPSATDAFRRRLQETFGWDASVPDEGQTVALD